MAKRKGIAKAVRHGKKYWRRGVNVDAVDAALEQRRADERAG